MPEGGRGSLWDELERYIETGDRQALVDRVQRALEEGLPAQEILSEGLISAMDVIGEKMEAEEMFIPEVLRAARTMEAGVDVLKPHLAVTDMRVEAKFVLGTVKGDQHDVGKNLVHMLLVSAGFDVIDLGVNVEPARFVAAVKETGARLVGLSALLTTTMPMMKATLDALEQAGVRESIKVLIGGAPVTQDFAAQIGADGYAGDAGTAIKVARALT